MIISQIGKVSNHQMGALQDSIKPSQGCSIVVLDVDMHPDIFKNLPSIKLASAINNRHLDFGNGIISECYVIYNDKAGKITTDFFSGDTRQTKERIRAELEKIKGDRSHL